MILTCPECATSYFVDDLKIPRGGRMVRCTNCQARWRAFQDRAEAETEAPEDELLVEDRPLPAPARPEDDIEFVAAPVTPVRKPPAPKRPRGLYVGVGVGIALAVLATVAVALRQPIASALPATSPLYAAVGLPVDTLGLSIEGVKSQAVLRAGRPALTVTGAIRNTRDAPVQAPPIRFNVLDKAGKPVSTALIQPLNGKIPPGATRYFAISLPGPPPALHKLDIHFEPGAPTAAVATPEAHAAAEPAPPPAEAQPLPPGSPDALQKHE